MCQSGISLPPTAAQRRPIAKAKRMKYELKRMNLITDEGFGRRLAANLLAVASVAAACSAHPRLRDACVDAYHDAREYAMRVASEMAWWSLLGLLSSSCCAIQVLLNAFSLGCAGFNGVLSPVRPTFIAATIVLQLGSWYAAYHSIRSQWKTTAVSTALSLCLTLLPEALAWQTAQRERFKRQMHNDKEGRRIHLQFKSSTIGCSSCVATVSKVLDGIDGVLQHSVSLAEGNAEVLLDEGVVNTSEGKDPIEDFVWNHIADKLQSAGFPVDTVFNSALKRK